MNMSGLRGELCYSIDKQLALILERNLLDFYPREWVRETLHKQGVEVIRGDSAAYTQAQLAKLNGDAKKGGLGLLYVVDYRGHLLVCLLRYLKPLRGGTSVRWQTRQELTAALPCSKPEWTWKPAHASDDPKDMDPVHPLAGNAYFEILTDLELFNTAMTYWLANTAPKLYARDLRSGAYKPKPEC